MTETLTSAGPAPAVTDDPADTVIAVRNLTKSYGDRQVVRDVSFEVRRQEIFGILGHNGAGKTTTVEIVQGLRRADGGEIRVLGLDPARDRDELTSSIGSQLQSSALPERLRVAEALRLFARIAGDVVDWRELAAEWELDRLERTAFGSLSGGEKQRLFLALALVQKPRLVFLDELTQGLDPTARRETWRLIERIRDHGATVVLVSHYMDEVERLCDRVGVLHEGRIAAIGTPSELVTEHGGAVQTRFTAHDADLGPTLAALAGVTDVHVDGTAYQVAGTTEAPFEVARTLDDHGLRPRDFSVLRPSLEDVFMTITGETIAATSREGAGR
ncbi:ABC transporter ATP-binding protein [Nocardioides speluncae]|uniref:ABC transporter ATP-binding protein n=1 Tax=Nocardioides speluncae TaxID=2670337 RepID=UPI000D68DCFF|nr:ABC transporter ATP-binding protein [Nocardioides speluncae]